MLVEKALLNNPKLHTTPGITEYVHTLSCSMIAAVGLVESSAVNIVAAMLVSPLMVRGPDRSI
jgi:uncharacterized membrane protein